MKLTVQHVNVRSTDAIDSLVEDRILALQPRLEIEEARVRLEHHHDLSPPFRVAVHLVTPGPDLFAEAEDHTLLAAINKVMGTLDTKVDQKQIKRTQKIRSNLQEPAESRRTRGKHPILRGR